MEEFSHEKFMGIEKSFLSAFLEVMSLSLKGFWGIFEVMLLKFGVNLQYLRLS
jgi:hypothetical protein